MSIELRIIHGMARTIQERVSELRAAPLSEQHLKRQQLRLFSELVIGTLQRILHGLLKDNGSDYECNAREKELVRRLRVTEKDLHSLLRSVDCDVL